MIFVQSIMALIEPVLNSKEKPSKEHFDKVCSLLAGGEFTYAYPYQLKELMMKFARYVALYNSEELMEKV